MLSRAASTLAHIFILAPLLLVLEGCGGTESGTSGSDAADRVAVDAVPLVEAAQAEITVEAMDVELDSIVQYDRLSGSPGEIAAVNYLVRTLEAEGIQVKVDTFLAYISDPISATDIYKVYFHRLIVPISVVLSGLMDLTVSFLVLLGMMAYYGFAPSLAMLTLPLYVLLATATALGVGLWSATLAVRFRDLKNAIAGSGRSAAGYFLLNRTSIWITIFSASLIISASMVNALS